MGRIKAEVFRNCLTRFECLSEVVFGIWRRRADLRGVFKKLKNFRVGQECAALRPELSRYHKSLSLYLSFSEQQNGRKHGRSRSTNRSCSPRLVRLSRHSSLRHLEGPSREIEDP